MKASPEKDNGGSTNSQTFFNMVRGVIGMGALTLPKAVAASGIIPVCIASVIIPFFAFQAAKWAVEMKRKHFGSLPESIAETIPLWRAESAATSAASNLVVHETAGAEDENADAFHACIGGFDVVVGEIFGTFWRSCFLVSVMSGEFSGGVAIISAVEEGWQIIFPNVSQNMGLACICIALMALTLLAPTLRDISFLSLASNLVVVYIFVSVPIEGIRNGPQVESITDRLPLWNASAGLVDYGYSLGAVTFCFLEFALVLCLQEDMKHKEDFEWVFGAAFSISAVIGAVFGAVGYWAFGAEVKELVYLNFPSGSPMTVICIVAYNFILIASYLLFMTPVFLFARALFPSIPYSVCRCTVVVLTAMMSKLLPSVMMVVLLVFNMNIQFAALVIPSCCYLRIGNSHDVVQRCIAYLCIATALGNMTIGFLSALQTSQ